ncbi:beta subunit of phenylalanyl-tRNA synthetase [Gigaspora rosea]|uniref:phenylalanine--tRNA ligase n=1 Tax=Gigaspora rosea TaxID=44941 RepID=A0A397UT60_9GLOM|nr:beta subunit of phenylalanyl-tRNA synthetase [Gigaspora rosea]
MPTVNVDKNELFQALGKHYTTEEFRELCFEFGIELEEDGLSERPILKIDIPSNRYDLLCHEGISRALLIFQEKANSPPYKLVEPADGHVQIVIKPETAQIRPHVVGAILRNIKFTERNYNNFIDLQDKLHNNICRKRTLVAIGTHDFDTIKGPFTYEALPPKEIKFTPLNQTKELDGEELMNFYSTDKHLGKFLHIICDSPVYPVIYDANRKVCSLPPIINGDLSKITLNTKNVFIECTATDLTKAKIVLNTVVTMFSEYCEQPFTAEPVKVIYPDGTERIYPDLSPRTMTVKADYINACTGLSLETSELVTLLKRMSLSAKAVNEEAKILVEVPPTRADVLHACDIMEDVAIAYGFNNIPKTLPACATVGKSLPVNKFSDLVRREIALAGWTEVLPLILCSHDENFAYLNKKDDNLTAVKLANPKTAEYQVVRTSLLPGVLKTVRENKKHTLPIKVFEVSDVVFKDNSFERLARNERHVCAIYCNKVSGFEIIHGLLNRIMDMLDVNLVSASDDKKGYFIKESDDTTYFPNRSADIFLRKGEASSNITKKIGSFGILHPQVLENFELTYPCSALEFNLEEFM